MKKLLQICLMAAMVVAFASCDKDDSSSNNSNSGDYPLNGTTWLNENGLNGDGYTYQISFGTTNCIFVKSNSEHNMQSPGTYTYSGTATSGHGTVTISNNGESVNITVDGQQMTVYDEEASMVLLRVVEG